MGTGHQVLETIANLGLTLLLFVIGLEVNLKSLLASGRTLLVTGALQVPLTLAAGCGAFLADRAHRAGRCSTGFYPALYLGVACAFSSTLLVVKYLQEHLRLDTVAGRLAVGPPDLPGHLGDRVPRAAAELRASVDSRRSSLTFVGTALRRRRRDARRALRAVARVPHRRALARARRHARARLVLRRRPLRREPRRDRAARSACTFQISVSMEMGALIAGATIATVALRLRGGLASRAPARLLRHAVLRRSRDEHPGARECERARCSPRSLAVDRDRCCATSCSCRCSTRPASTGGTRSRSRRSSRRSPSSAS